MTVKKSATYMDAFHGKQVNTETPETFIASCITRPCTFTEQGESLVRPWTVADIGGDLPAFAVRRLGQGGGKGQLWRRSIDNACDPESRWGLAVSRRPAASYTDGEIVTTHADGESCLAQIGKTGPASMQDATADMG